MSALGLLVPGAYVVADVIGRPGRLLGLLLQFAFHDDVVESEQLIDNGRLELLITMVYQPLLFF